MDTTAQVSVTRTIRASRQRVFRAWTEPELMMRWFVEGDWEMTLCEIDLRKGGRYRFEGATDGKKWAIWGSNLDVRPLERLVYTWIWEHDQSFGDPTGDTQVTGSSGTVAATRRSFSRTSASSLSARARITPRDGASASIASNSCSTPEGIRRTP